jgi:hypothetical protein
MMFDSSFFSESLPQRISETVARTKCGSPVVRVCLQDGGEYYIHSIADIQSGWVTLNAYPPGAASGGRIDSEAERDILSTTVTYEIISQIVVTGSTGPAAIGFRR